MTQTATGIVLSKSEVKTIESALMILQNLTRKETGAVPNTASKSDKRKKVKAAVKNFVENLG